MNDSKPTIIHVNRQHIAMNAKDNGSRPVYTVKLPNGTVRYGREVFLSGPSRMIYDGTQLACGARAWVQTFHEVVILDEMSFLDARNS